MIRILASVILFNPDIVRLQRCLSSIIEKVEHIRFVDNNSKNKKEIENFVKDIPNASILWNEKNLGLPKAFNTLINYSKDNGYTHLLLLDQDSIPAENFIDEYKKNISDDYVCLVPLITHQSEEYQKIMEYIPHEPKELVRDSANSGALININKLPPNVKFDENLFVDWVDIDFFIQLQKEGMKVLRINTTKLSLNAGDKRVHHIFKYTWFSFEYSIFRLMKQARDTVIFFKKNKLSSDTKGSYIFILWIWLMMLLFEQKKLKKTYAIISGIFQGLFSLNTNK